MVSLLVNVAKVIKFTLWTQKHQIWFCVEWPGTQAATEIKHITISSMSKSVQSAVCIISISGYLFPLFPPALIKSATHPVNLHWDLSGRKTEGWTTGEIVDVGYCFVLVVIPTSSSVCCRAFVWRTSVWLPDSQPWDELPPVDRRSGYLWVTQTMWGKVVKKLNPCYLTNSLILQMWQHLKEIGWLFNSKIFISKMHCYNKQLVC